MSSLVLHVAAQTDTGLVRAHNEDAIALDVTHGIIALADGMGGYNAGEVASRMAADGVVNYLRDAMQCMAEADDQAKISDLRQLLVGAITKANDNIRAAALGEAHLHGMGTTLVAALFCDSKLVLAHLGDSRCYRLREGAFVQLTRDHSQVQEQVDAG
ncbi:protein phosphatase 2C domain-containing protein, partial [uncultured Oxalicibacterium sp.]|uniref:PP2C family protein-serine/threonine phosphatase n=1 Tax=uncultured Oxalicibacterium sp. TaxID=1168540 RepID=UPI0025F90CEC